MFKVPTERKGKRTYNILLPTDFTADYFRDPDDSLTCSLNQRKILNRRERMKETARPLKFVRRADPRARLWNAPRVCAARGEGCALFHQSVPRLPPLLYHVIALQTFYCQERTTYCAEKEMKRRGPNRIWKEEDIQLIEAVKQHKHLYDAPISELNKVAYKRLCSKSWDEISSKLGMPAMELRKKWIFIKSYYKKAFIIKNYTGKFLDGTLDFLKPWASNIHSNYEEMEISNISSTEEDNVSDSEATINLPLETITCLNKEGSSERHIETIDPLAPCSSQYAVNFEEQVLSNVNSDVANANDQRKLWTQEDLILIEAIKPHKSLYTVPTRTSDRVLNKKESAMAWTVVASQLGMPVMELRHKWRAMKNNYKEAIIKEDSSKLLDGTLDFLKPWASHYIMNSNDETTDDEAMESFSILPTEEDGVMYVDSSDSDIEATITPPLENNHIIDESSESDMETTDILRSCSGQYAINYGEQILPDVNNDVENANDYSILRNILIQKRGEICEESQNHEETSHSDLLSDFFARYDGTTHDSNLMEYFRDLAEVLCVKLEPAKRQNFIRQIDLIVSQILTENKNDNEDIEELE